MTPFSDELAAPYGVAASGEAIDVVNKYGLLRLWDDDRDGQADRTELLASGWGHTLDYHDWAIGLPRDRAGNYYVALPCQQDDRSQVAAALRGQVVRLVPRESTADDPRRYAIDPLAAGLRFPNGIALSPDEELFVTDNQGNYTPFNELNHIVRGARYGFINRLESKQGLEPGVSPGGDRDSASLDAERQRHLLSRAAGNAWCRRQSGRRQKCEEAVWPLRRPDRRLRVRYAAAGADEPRARGRPVAGGRVSAVDRAALRPADVRRAAGLPAFARGRSVRGQHPRQRLGSRLEHRLDRAAPLARRSAGGDRRSAGRAWRVYNRLHAEASTAAGPPTRGNTRSLRIAARQRPTTAAPTRIAAWRRSSRSLFPPMLGKRCYGWASCAAASFTNSTCATFPMRSSSSRPKRITRYGARWRRAAGGRSGKRRDAESCGRRVEELLKADPKRVRKQPVNRQLRIPCFSPASGLAPNHAI